MPLMEGVVSNIITANKHGNKIYIVVESAVRRPTIKAFVVVRPKGRFPEKKTAVLLDFVQITSPSSPNLENLYNLFPASKFKT